MIGHSTRTIRWLSPCSAEPSVMESQTNADRPSGHLRTLRIITEVLLTHAQVSAFTEYADGLPEPLTDLPTELREQQKASDAAFRARMHELLAASERGIAELKNWVAMMPDALKAKLLGSLTAVGGDGEPIVPEEHRPAIERLLRCRRLDDLRGSASG
jgi:hypothetical protein